MEAFHILSRGGVNFDKQRFKGDVKLFRVRLTRFTQVDFFPSNFSRELLIMMPRVEKKRHSRMASCPLSLIFSNMQWRALRNASPLGLMERITQRGGGTRRKIWPMAGAPTRRTTTTTRAMVTVALLLSATPTLECPNNESPPRETMFLNG